MALSHQIIEFLDRLPACRRVQMPVGLERRLYVLVSQTLTHQQNGCPQSDEERRMGVSEIMQAYLFHTAGVTPLLHLSVEVALCVGEKPVIWLGFIEGVHVVLNFVA